MIELPRQIFFTGAPGSKWSGIAQFIETLDGVNTSDRIPSREYFDNGALRHTGAYFGPGNEFPASPEVVADAYTTPEEGCMIAKSHHWAYTLDDIKQEQCDSYGDWIMLVYRPDMVSFSWWMEVGGFRGIDYPVYTWYENPEKMFYEIQVQNRAMLKFAFTNKLKWEYFTSEWMLENFGESSQTEVPQWDDVLVTIYRP